MITIVIADDHPIVRKGIRDLLTEDGRYNVVAELGDGGRVLDIVRQLHPRVLLLDLNMPGANGLEVAQQLRHENLDVQIIIMTMHKEEEIFSRAMDLGVKGYLLKESAED